MTHRWLSIPLALLFVHCDPVAMAPPKTDAPSTTDLALNAKRSFWTALHAARYESIDGLLEDLTAAYIEAPSDSELALLTAHAHLWRLSERSRLDPVPARITDHAALAAHYFSQAERMSPEDDRIPGWLGGTLAALGSINDDERLKRQGYFTLLDSAARFPEFNHFSFGYALSTLPPEHARWPEVVAAMWTSVDVCAGRSVPREAPDYEPFASQKAEEADLAGRRRVCWNSALAPHNFEGFFLHNGDVLVKNGQPEVAIVMYENAKLSRTYGSWTYRDVLEERIASAPARARRFGSDGSGEMMVSSSFACTGCHAE